MRPEPEPSGEIRLILPSDQGAVHQALKTLFAGQRLGPLAEAERGAAEIVLAEVLNNVVEHAYSMGPGEIEVTIRIAAATLDFTVIDKGQPMPDGRPPSGEPMTLNRAADLPEGGFGWLLIRALTCDLCYRRIGDQNRLTFRLSTGQ